MSADPPISEAERYRHWITDVEISPENADPNCKFSARVFLDNELVCNLSWIDHTRPLRWTGLLLCDASSLSTVAVRLCRSLKGKSRYFNFPPSIVSEADETGETTLELPEAAWVVSVKSLTPAVAEQLFLDQLEKFKAIEGAYSSHESNETAKYLFKNALQFTSFVVEALPKHTAKISFLICMKAWEVLNQQSQVDDKIQAILRSLVRIREIVDIVGQASGSMLSSAINRSKEPIYGILDLIEDISLYIFNRCAINDLAHVPSDEAGPNEVEGVELYLARLEDLQNAFHTSWSPAATSNMDPIYSVDSESLDPPSQNQQTAAEEPTGGPAPYEALNLLRPMDPSGYDPDQACFDGTRNAVLNKTITWSQNRDNPECFLWISGQAGMGKTAIATSLCQRLYDIRALAASFFCRRDDPDSSDPLRLINNLAHSIAIRVPPYALEIANIIRRDRSLCTSHLSLRYEYLVKRPLERLKLLSVPVTLVVVIDGLDECGNMDSREKILQKLYNLSQLVPWLKVIFTGRPVGDIQRYFRTHCSHEPIIHLHDYDASDDIRAYIEDRLRRLAQTERWAHNSINQLCDTAQGLFLWAALATNYIAKSTFPSSPRLQKVLNNYRSPVTDHLDTVYTRALKIAVADDEEEIKIAHIHCIGAILAISKHGALTIPDLQDLLLVTGQSDQATLDQVVNNLAPLLFVDGARIRLLHRSFGDFITSSSRSGEFHIRPDQCEADPATACLKIMQRDLQFNVCGLETSHLFNTQLPNLKLRIQTHIGPALKYACLHWIDHFISLPSQALVETIKGFLEGPTLMYWIEALSLLGRLDIAVSGLYRLASLDLAQFSDWSLIIPWLKDAYRFLLSFYNAISASTPHLYVSALAFSPSKSLTAERMRPYFPNTVTTARDPGSTWHPCVKTILHPRPIQSLSITPDGSKTIVGYLNGSLGIWDLKTGAQIGEALVGHTDSVTCIATSSNGDLVSSGSHDTTIRVWDLKNCRNASHALAGHSGPVHAVAFSPNSDIIASGSSDKTIRLWDPKSMSSIHGAYAGHSSRVSSLAFSPDGIKLASGSWDKTIRVWTVAPGGQQLVDNPLVISGYSDSVTCVAFSPDGSKIASGSVDRAINMLDSQTGRKVESCPSLAKHSDSVTSIAFSSNGGLIVSASLDGEIKLYNTTTLETLTPPFGHSSPVNAVIFSPIEPLIISGSTDMTTRVWEIDERPKPATRPPINTHSTPIITHTAPIYSVAISRDGARIISGSSDQTVRMWDAKTGSPIGNPLTGHTGQVNSVAISSHGTRIASGSGDNYMKFWDADTNSHIKNCSHSYGINSVAFSPDNTIIAFGTQDSRIYLWEIAGWTTTKGPLQEHSGAVVSIAFSPNGTYIASASEDRTLILWDIRTHSRSGQPFSDHTDPVRSVSFSPCSTQLVSGSDDQTVRTWDVKTGKLIRILHGHLNCVRAVAFSPDGSFIASGSDDKTVRLWDAKTGQAVHQPFTGHSNIVRSIAFLPDGSHIISGSDDKTIRSWSLNTLSPTVRETDASQDAFCWPTSPFELSSHPHHPGWVTYGQKSLAFWLPPHYQKPEQFLSVDDRTQAPSSRRQTFLDYSKFVHGTAWTAVAASPNVRT